MACSASGTEDGSLLRDREDVAFDAAAAELEALEEDEASLEPESDLTKPDALSKRHPINAANNWPMPASNACRMAFRP